MRALPRVENRYGINRTDRKAGGRGPDRSARPRPRPSIVSCPGFWHRIAIGNPLMLSLDFPPLHTVHAAFTAHGVPSNSGAQGFKHNLHTSQQLFQRFTGGISASARSLLSFTSWELSRFSSFRYLLITVSDTAWISKCTVLEINTRFA